MAYIDKDELYEAITDLPFTEGCAVYDSYDVENTIRDFSEADVQEVKHGKWVSARPSGDSDFYCSCCKEFAITYEDSNYEEQYCLTDYCPNCGAKMDLVGDDNGNL